MKIIDMRNEGGLAASDLVPGQVYRAYAGGNGGNTLYLAVRDSGADARFTTSLVALDSGTRYPSPSGHYLPVPTAELRA